MVYIPFLGTCISYILNKIYRTTLSVLSVLLDCVLVSVEGVSVVKVVVGLGVIVVVLVNPERTIMNILYKVLIGYELQIKFYFIYFTQMYND